MTESSEKRIIEISDDEMPDFPEQDTISPISSLAEDPQDQALKRRQNLMKDVAVGSIALVFSVLVLTYWVYISKQFQVGAVDIKLGGFYFTSFIALVLILGNLFISVVFPIIYKSDISQDNLGVLKKDQ